MHIHCATATHTVIPTINWRWIFHSLDPRAYQNVAQRANHNNNNSYMYNVYIHCTYSFILIRERERKRENRAEMEQVMFYCIIHYTHPTRRTGPITIRNHIKLKWKCFLPVDSTVHSDHNETRYPKTNRTGNDGIRFIYNKYTLVGMFQLPFQRFARCVPTEKNWCERYECWQ